MRRQPVAHPPPYIQSPLKVPELPGGSYLSTSLPPWVHLLTSFFPSTSIPLPVQPNYTPSEARFSLKPGLPFHYKNNAILPLCSNHPLLQRKLPGVKNIPPRHPAVTPPTFPFPDSSSSFPNLRTGIKPHHNEPHLQGKAHAHISPFLPTAACTVILP